MHDEKTYKDLIADFLKKEEKASLKDIYKEVQRRRTHLPKSWKPIVRNKLYHSNMFVKIDNEWKLKQCISLSIK